MSGAERGFSTADVIRLARVDDATLRFWVRRGLIVPSVRFTKGSGRPWLWSKQDVLAVRLIVQIRALCDTFEIVRAAVDLIERRLDEENWLVAGKGEDGPIAYTGHAVIRPHVNCDLVIIADLARLQAGLDEE